MSESMLLINAATALMVSAPQPVMLIQGGSVGPAGPDITVPGNGIMARTALNTYANRTLQAPAAGFAITNPDGVAGNPVFVLSNDLAALEGIIGTGYAKRTGVDTWTAAVPTPGEIGAEVAGAAASAIAAHVALADPHAQYRLESVSVPWSEVSGTPTTIAGYGITDAYTKAQSDSLYSVLAHTHSFASLTGIPTTIAGYGLIDAQPLNIYLTGISGIGFGTRGFLVRTGVSTFDTRVLGVSLNRISITDFDGIAGNPIIDISAAYVGQASITTLGTIATGIWNGASIATTFTDAKLKTLAGTANRITVGGTATDPTVDIHASYVGQASITTLGTIATGVWNGTSITTTFTDAKLKTLTGTANRITIGGTATDPTVDVHASYVGQASITTLGTIATGVWNAGAVTSSAAVTAATELRAPIVSSNAASDLDLKTSGGVQLRVKHIASTTNFVSVEGANAGPPRIVAAGADADISPQFVSKGNGNLDFITGGTGAVRMLTGAGSVQARFTHTPGADRSLTLTGSNGGNPVIGTNAGALSFDPTTKQVLLFPGTAVPSGGTAGVGLAFSSTANLGVFFGLGAPTLAAAKGSLYIRTDGSATNNRAYVNTDGGTTWTAITTVA